MKLDTTAFIFLIHSSSNFLKKTLIPCNKCHFSGSWTEHNFGHNMRTGSRVPTVHVAAIYHQLLLRNLVSTFRQEQLRPCIAGTLDHL